MRVKQVPEGYHTATPYLLIGGASKAIDYYRKAFGAEEVMRFADPSGTVAHAEIQIGDSRIMLGEEMPQIGFRGPRTIGSSPAGIALYVADVDAVFDRAIAAGGTAMRPVVDQFYGDRSGTLTDPFGHVWTVATHIEDVPPEEMRRRFEAHMKTRG
jgi:PhnB protein